MGLVKSTGALILNFATGMNDCSFTPKGGTAQRSSVDASYGKRVVAMLLSPLSVSGLGIG